MRVPTIVELLNPTLIALHALGGSGSIKDLAQQVADDLCLPQDVIQQSRGSGGRTEYEARLSWARTNLKKFGMIDNSKRGVWSLTPLGSTVFTVDPSEVERFGRYVSATKSPGTGLRRRFHLGTR